MTSIEEAYFQRPCNKDEQNNNKGGDQLIWLDVGHFPLCGGFVVFFGPFEWLLL